ncbi:hypothetical protein [Paenibacillus popilliae]|uniref:Predicted membrane protein n=1 Tax=Paenibacillus popilliae ATCC 14706 TaxID=1212764 RepID=M9LZM6_PAEPP|nr:hypothetical protein [Paenibacillus popilliae]GAC41784.1 predicted membrane protein [Paenibacillus popilliae ATCC 14706]
MKKLGKMMLVSSFAFCMVMSSFAIDAIAAADKPGIGNYSFYLSKGNSSITRPGVKKVKKDSSAINNNEDIDGAKFSLRSRVLDNDENAVSDWHSFDE